MARPSDVGVGVLVALLDWKDQKVLMMQRQGSHAAGTWALPGGWIDRSDANLLDVVKREAMEELGVTVHDAVLIDAVTADHPDKGFRSVTLYYLATSWVGPYSIQEPEKCSALQWHDLHAEVPEPSFPGLKEGMKAIHRYMFGDPPT